MNPDSIFVSTSGCLRFMPAGGLEQDSRDFKGFLTLANCTEQGSVVQQWGDNSSESSPHFYKSMSEASINL